MIANKILKNNVLFINLPIKIIELIFYFMQKNSFGSKCNATLNVYTIFNEVFSFVVARCFRFIAQPGKYLSQKGQRKSSRV